MSNLLNLRVRIANPVISPELVIPVICVTSTPLLKPALGSSTKVYLPVFVLSRKPCWLVVESP